MNHTHVPIKQRATSSSCGSTTTSRPTPSAPTASRACPPSSTYVRAWIAVSSGDRRRLTTPYIYIAYIHTSPSTPNHPNQPPDLARRRGGGRGQERDGGVQGRGPRPLPHAIQLRGRGADRQVRGAAGRCVRGLGVCGVVEGWMGGLVWLYMGCARWTDLDWRL